MMSQICCERTLGEESKLGNVPMGLVARRVISLRFDVSIIFHYVAVLDAARSQLFPPIIWNVEKRWSSAINAIDNRYLRERERERKDLLHDATRRSRWEMEREEKDKRTDFAIYIHHFAAIIWFCSPWLVVSREKQSHVLKLPKRVRWCFKQFYSNV